MVFEIICGQLGFPPDAFWEMTGRETQLIIRGHSKKREQDYRMQMEAARLSGYMAVMPYLKRSQSITSIMKFPWEEGGASDSGNRITRSVDTLILSDDPRKITGSYSIPKDSARPAKINRDPVIIEEYLRRKRAKKK